MRSRRLLASTALLTVALAAPALGQYPPCPASAFVTDTQVEIGQCTLFGGGPFVPASPVAITDNGSSLGNGIAGADGILRFEVCFDSTSTIGVHVLVGTGENGDEGCLTEVALQRLGTRARTLGSRVPGRVAPLAQAVPPPTSEVRGSTRIITATVIVVGLRLQNPDVEPGGSGLPRTGADTTVPALVAGLLLLVTGSGLTVAARNRRRSLLSRGA